MKVISNITISDQIGSSFTGNEDLSIFAEAINVIHNSLDKYGASAQLKRPDVLNDIFLSAANQIPSLSFAPVISNPRYLTEDNNGINCTAVTGTYVGWNVLDHYAIFDYYDPDGDIVTDYFYLKEVSWGNGNSGWCNTPFYTGIGTTPVLVSGFPKAFFKGNDNIGSYVFWHATSKQIFQYTGGRINYKVAFLDKEGAVSEYLSFYDIE